MAPARLQENPEQAFRAFLSAHGKAYAPHKFAERLAVFRANADLVSQHDSQDAGFTLGLNQFADLTFEEFSSTHLGLLPLANGSYRCARPVCRRLHSCMLAGGCSHAGGACRAGGASFRYADSAVPKSVDWVRRLHGVHIACTGRRSTRQAFRCVRTGEARGCDGGEEPARLWIVRPRYAHTRLPSHCCCVGKSVR